MIVENVLASRIYPMYRKLHDIHISHKIGSETQSRYSFIVSVTEALSYDHIIGYRWHINTSVFIGYVNAGKS